MASMGDLLGFWYGQWITFAVRHLAKMVPAYKLPLTEGRRVTTIQSRAGGRNRQAAAASQATHDSIAFLQYTGGTTGLSKGAVLTHRNIVAAILQAEAWFTPALKRVGERQQDQQHRRAAAVPHLRADAVPAGHPLGLAHDDDSQPSRLRKVC
jgi:long-chain acyl-CoA synthetase